MARKHLLVALSLAGIATAGFAGFEMTRRHATVQPNDVVNGATVLPNGWRVSPAGQSVALGGDMPTKAIWLPGGKQAVILTSGFNSTGLSVVDANTGEFQKKIVLAQAWCGLSLSQDGTRLFVSEGGVGIAVFAVEDGQLGPRLQVPEKVFGKTGWVAGLQALPNGQLAALDMNAGELNFIDTPNMTIAKKVKVGEKPYSVILLKDGNLAVTNEGGKSVSIVDPSAAKVTATIQVGSHPTEIIQAQDGRLLVANAGSNSVSVISGTRVVETIRTSLTPKALVGSTPISLTVTPDSHRLYVANADNNDVAVIDLGHGGPSKVLGFIPTGWYPSLVALGPDGKLWVGAGKGLKFGSNRPDSPKKLANGRIVFKYIGGLLTGALNLVEIPDQEGLANYTAQVMSNAPLSQPVYTAKEIAQAQKTILSKIKHVVYIIRENRTYDQVFGDFGKGNGDPSLTMFGAEVTPNAHKLASEYVLLDNTYCNGEVSQDGHQWCNAAYCTEFTEKAWISSYSRRGEPDGGYDVDASPAGFLWDNCRKHGKSYMAYGEASSFTSTPDTAPVFTGDPGLTGHASLDWENDKKYGDRDYQRMEVFLDDLRKGEQTGNWPNFMVMSLGEDHTSGYAPGRHTPEASVASNDLALGKLVDAVSHSRFWKDTAIFVIEDDAQNGPDHVDAHRTVALFISPYTHRGGLVDSNLYTTASFVRTMELCLGLPPMTQYDEGATPMLGSITDKPDFSPYSLVQESLDLNAMNPNNTALSRRSAKLDFSAYDRANPDELNAILWQGIKGGQMPAPVRSAVIRR